MSQRTPRSTLLLFLIMVRQIEVRIWKINRCFELVVRVEKQREKTMLGKCFRCQRWGHSQAQCRMDVRCVKCGDNHHAAECWRLREEPVTDALWRKPHPANYRRCRQAPKREIPDKQSVSVTLRIIFASAAAGRPTRQELRNPLTTTMKQEGSLPEPEQKSQRRYPGRRPETNVPRSLADVNGVLEYLKL